MSNGESKPIKQRKGWQEIYTTANMVTITRILLIPAFIILMLAPWASWMPEPALAALIKPWLAAAVFILLAATDGLDGYLARSRNEITTFGKLLDPLADKILVSAALLALIELSILPAWIALVILGREFLVSGLRMVALAEGKVIAASPLGKLKTVFQIIAVVTLIVKDSLVTIWGIWFGGDGGSLAWIMNILAWTVMAITLIITIGSLVDYFINSAEVLGFEYSGRWARKTVLGELDDNSEKGDGRGAGELSGEQKGSGELGGELKGSGELNDLSSDLHINELSTAILELAREKSLTIATAESCTGGLVAAALTDIPGSSDVFNGSIVSYANSIKQGLLAVPDTILATDGAVSESCVRQMAISACQALESDFAVATSGIAGPDGGTSDKPVGTVWLAVAGPDGAVSRCELFTGDRSLIRQQAVSVVLQMLYQALTEAEIKI